MPGGQWKTNIDGAVSNEDWSALVQLARREPAKTLRYLTSRLCSADAPLKWKAVRALAAVAGDREGMSENRIRRLLQRFLWLLSDESGNVPYGVPEAFGEVIEQGVFWALGRVGQPAAACSAEAVEAVVRASRQHPEPETRSIASWARSRF